MSKKIVIEIECDKASVTIAVGGRELTEFNEIKHGNVTRMHAVMPADFTNIADEALLEAIDEIDLMKLSRILIDQ